jgi:hypothetical protein
MANNSFPNSIAPGNLSTWFQTNCHPRHLYNLNPRPNKARADARAVEVADIPCAANHVH